MASRVPGKADGETPAMLRSWCIVTGTRVKIRGLEKRGDLNGVVGSSCGKTGTGRIAVDVGGARVSVGPDHLDISPLPKAVYPMDIWLPAVNEFECETTHAQTPGWWRFATPGTTRESFVAALLSFALQVLPKHIAFLKRLIRDPADPYAAILRSQLGDLETAMLVARTVGDGLAPALGAGDSDSGPDAEAILSQNLPPLHAFRGPCMDCPHTPVCGQRQRATVRFGPDSVTVDCTRVLVPIAHPGGRGGGKHNG